MENAHEVQSAGAMLGPGRIRALVADEDPAEPGLATLLAAEPDVDVIGRGDPPPDLVSAVTRHAPDVVVVGARAAGAIRLAVLAAQRRDRMPLLVLVASLDPRMAWVFELGAFDYLIRPFTARRVRDLVDRIREDRRLRRQADAGTWLMGAVAQFRERYPPADDTLVGADQQVRGVDLSAIQWIEARGNYVRLHLAGESVLLRETIASISHRLRAQFVRVHRRYAVRRDMLGTVEVAGPSACRVVLFDGTTLPVGRRYRHDVDQFARCAAIRGEPADPPGDHRD